jgi:hypothetical protein
MAHWTDDPKLHGLMTHLGKVSQSGKPTRGAFVAEQVSTIMIKIEFDQAKEDLVSQNPNADVDAFNKDLRQALEDLDADYKKALTGVDGIKQTIRVKRTTMRGLEDRMEVYRKQVQRQMPQLMKSVEPKAA